MLPDENTLDPIVRANFTPSEKGNLYIIHKGSPGTCRQTFTSPLTHPKWPQNLNEIGTQIYSNSDQSLCLPPPPQKLRRKADRILRFESRFESGNLQSAYHLEQDTYRLELERDANRSGSCQWFYFGISNTRKDTVYTFYISGFHKSRDVLNQGSKIFMHSQKGATSTGNSWTRAGYNIAYGYIPTEPPNNPNHPTANCHNNIRRNSCVSVYPRGPSVSRRASVIRPPNAPKPIINTDSNATTNTDSNLNPNDIDNNDSDSDNDIDAPNSNGNSQNEKPKKNRACLQFQIKFQYDFDTVYLCYSLPYTYTDLLHSISIWTKNCPGSITTETLCQTIGGKNCPLLTITSPNTPIEKKKIIFITGRVHPGESNSSYVVHGLIDCLLAPTTTSRYLLDHYTFKIIPMINIDGVIEGFYRCSLSGFDLNRVWSSPDPILHPVIYNARQLMERDQLSIALYIDFHGHSRLHGTFAYGCPNELDNLLRDKEKVFPRLLSMLSDAFVWDKCVFSYPNDRKSSGRIVARKELGIIQSFTIESSFGGIQQGPLSGILNDERIWKGIGAKVVDTIYHYFNQSTGVRKFVERELQNGIDPAKQNFSSLQWQREMRSQMEHRIIAPTRTKPNSLAMPFGNSSTNTKAARQGGIGANGSYAGCNGMNGHLNLNGNGNLHGQKISHYRSFI